MRHLEDMHQEMIFAWSKSIRLNPLNAPCLPNEKLFDYMFAIPNGGRRRKLEAARLKKQGVKAGVSDIFIALPIGRYSGLFMELKRPMVKNSPKPVVSDNQKIWLKRSLHAGYYSCVCYGFDDAVKVIEDYLLFKLE